MHALFVTIIDELLVVLRFRLAAARHKPN